MTMSKIISSVCVALENNDLTYTVNGDGTISCELPIDLMKVPKIILRKVEESKLPSLKNGLKAEGQKQAILLKPVLEPVEGSTESTLVFYIYDGLHRWTAMTQLVAEGHIQFLSGKVLIDENATLMSSVILNTARITQKPDQIAKVVEYLVNTEGLLLSEVSTRLNQPLDFVEKHFKLSLLNSAAMSALSAGEIGLSVAVELAKAEKTAGNVTPFPEDFKAKLLVEALGKGESGQKATPEMLSKMKASKRAQMNAIARGENKSTVLTPQYKHTEIFDNDRWQEIVSTRDSLLDSVELDGHVLSDIEKELIRIVDHVVTSNEEDRRKSRESFEANMKKIKAVL